jgi:hypothetical protein
VIADEIAGNQTKTRNDCHLEQPVNVKSTRLAI